MARIKVTGYLDTDEMNPDDVDLAHPMGISANAYERWSAAGGVEGEYLEDLEFEKEN